MHKSSTDPYPCLWGVSNESMYVYLIIEFHFEGELYYWLHMIMDYLFQVRQECIFLAGSTHQREADSDRINLLDKLNIERRGLQRKVHTHSSTFLFCLILIFKVKILAPPEGFSHPLMDILVLFFGWKSRERLSCS